MDEKATPKPEAKAKAVEAEVKPKPKPEPIVINAEPAKAPEPAPAPAMPIEPPSAPEPPKAEVPAPEPEKPKAPEPAKLFSVKTDTYSAWVTQNGEKSYLANLELTGGSAYNWPADSAKEAEALLQYHIANQKL